MKRKVDNMSTKGIYHSNECLQFAHLLANTGIGESISNWMLIVGGDDSPCSRHKFETIEGVKEFLSGGGFHPLNLNIVLCPFSQKAHCKNDEFFWERMSVVYGPDALSLVLYDDTGGYNIAGLYNTLFWRVPYTWIWYGETSDPALETWLHEQIIEEIATIAFKAEKFAYDDVYDERTTRIARISYRNDGGKQQLFQFENGNAIEF